MNRAPKYMAHVLMGIHEHQAYVTHEMALDAGNPDLEGTPYSEGEEEVWEDRFVVLEEDYEKAIEQARRNERERIAQFVESMDLGFVADKHHVTANIAESIRAIFEEAEIEELERNWIAEWRSYREGWERGKKDGIVTGYIIGVISFLVVFVVLWVIFM